MTPNEYDPYNPKPINLQVLTHNLYYAYNL